MGESIQLDLEWQILKPPMENFRVNHRGPGAKQFSPHLMLALLIYSHANGLFSSRMIERATPRDVAIPYLTAGTHPDHDTICKFHRENLDAFRESFVDVLELARESSGSSLARSRWMGPSSRPMPTLTRM